MAILSFPIKLCALSLPILSLSILVNIFNNGIQGFSGLIYRQGREKSWVLSEGVCCRHGSMAC